MRSDPWLPDRWWQTMGPDQRDARFASLWAPFWREWHKEIRRYAGDERLPLGMRARLRDVAQRSLQRSSSSGIEARVRAPFPRRRLRDKGAFPLPASIVAGGPEAAAALGLTGDPPIVAIEIRRRPDVFADAIAWLSDLGYRIVRVGDAADPVGRDDVLELSRLPQHTRALDIVVVSMARFVVCESREVQHVAYLTETPSLLLNARDPFSGYPVRRDGVFMLAAAIDLDSGETVTPHELDERYVRRLRNCGFRSSRPGEILAAVQEMHEGVTTGAVESPAQARFRERVLGAGAALKHLPLVAEWGPEDGFIGDGRLVRFQAESLARPKAGSPTPEAFAP